MVSDYREPLRSGHELGRMRHQRLRGDQYELSSLPRSQPHPHPLSSTQNHDLREAVLREIEKESMRQEIIMSELIRRRALEAQVSYEMRMERAMAIERGINAFPSEDSRPMGLDVPKRFPLSEMRAEDRFLEDRNGRGNEAKPIINITGAKRARAGSGSSRSQSGNVKKKAKEEWSCALCQVSVGNKRTLNMHLAGKKHKREEAALNARKAGKNSSSMPLGTDKVVDSMEGSEITHPAINSEVKLASESSPYGNNVDASSATDGPSPLDRKLNSDNFKKKKKMQEPEKTLELFWCEICQVSMARNHKMMDAHQQDDKHKRRVKLSDRH